ncbi:MAG: Dihydroorotate dehydrogenase B (NAD(+)), catalytic subunit [Actinobacteria bacterium ADurb.Bin346]|nr:MAG: Dihydroorotate dehydrogenase B (NAD(+)), catalytic subunit [Actinobacteria bacterium ADurb.Bin346]
MNEVLKNNKGLSLTIGKSLFKNPVFVNSGTFAGGVEYNAFFDISKLGAVTTKSFSLEKKEGNAPPRIWETSSGMLNSIGLQNEGINYFLDTQLCKMKELGADIILSIFGCDTEEFKKIAAKIKTIEKELKAVELNLSCPNVREGGMAFCAAPGQIGPVVSEIKNIIDVPLIVKLSPNFNTIIESAIISKENGADAISIINTITGTAFDIETFKPRLANISGGLSGPAIKPVALFHVYRLAKEKILPVIGMGGISCWQDAVEFLIAGACAIGVGTANFINPVISEKIIEGIAGYMVSMGFSSLDEMVGKAIKES